MVEFLEPNQPTKLLVDHQDKELVLIISMNMT